MSNILLTSLLAQSAGGAHQKEHKMKSKKVFEYLRELIGEDRIDEVIKKLQSMLKNSHLLKEVIVQSARYNDVMESIRLGRINYEDANVTKNKIRFALIHMIEILENQVEINSDIDQEVERVGGINTTITVDKSKNVVTGKISTNNGNIHIGDTIHQRKEGEIKWAGLSIVKAEDTFYKSDSSGKTIRISPSNSLQEIADWPGRYGQELPLFIDLKFINVGDTSKIINEVRLFVKDAKIDNLPSFEQDIYINNDENLVFCIRNYGWGKNEIIDFKILGKESSPYWNNINQASLKSIETIDGHIDIEMSKDIRCDLVPMSNEEYIKFEELYNRTDPIWTPNPCQSLFAGYNPEAEAKTEFTKYRDALILQKKILDSKSFYGQLSVKANREIINRKLNWGYVSYQGLSNDLILKDNGEGYALFSYQEPLDYMPPSMEYNVKLSEKDKGKVLTIDTSHILKGGDGDRFIIKIKPMESLFADVEISIKTDEDKIITYPKELDLNLLRYKQNGKGEITSKDVINEKKYFFDGKSIEERASANNR